jgi:thiamine-phosphate pyrophosphorylase
LVVACSCSSFLLFVIPAGNLLLPLFFFVRHSGEARIPAFRRCMFLLVILTLSAVEGEGPLYLVLVCFCSSFWRSQNLRISSLLVSPNVMTTDPIAMHSPLLLPRLYAIIDAELLAARSIPLASFACDLRAAGVTLLQYRDKNGSPQDVLRAASILREAMAGSNCRLILNDRADLAVLANFDGVHVGQGDLAPQDARRVVGPDRIVGVSTHTYEQVRIADQSCADYIAIGPVFATRTKRNPDPVVGLEGVRRARSLTRKPLVAIGGLTRSNARSVLDAGANTIAVISSLFAANQSPQQVARDFLARLR